MLFRVGYLVLEATRRIDDGDNQFQKGVAFYGQFVWPGRSVKQGDSELNLKSPDVLGDHALPNFLSAGSLGDTVVTSRVVKAG